MTTINHHIELTNTPRAGRTFPPHLFSMRSLSVQPAQYDHLYMTTLMYGVFFSQIDQMYGCSTGGWVCAGLHLDDGQHRVQLWVVSLQSSEGVPGALQHVATTGNNNMSSFSEHLPTTDNNKATMIERSHKVGLIKRIQPYGVMMGFYVFFWNRESPFWRVPH